MFVPFSARCTYWTMWTLCSFLNYGGQPAAALEWFHLSEQLLPGVLQKLLFIDASLEPPLKNY